MLLNLQVEARTTAGPFLVAVAAAGGIAFAGLVLAGLRHAAPAVAADVPAGFGETTAVARALFTVYLVPFELTSVLLLVAIVGAVALAKKGT